VKPNVEIEVPFAVTSESEEETLRIGRRFAMKLQRGDIVALFGELGSGKTRLVQGVCGGLAVGEPVVSPTFTIVNQYTGKNGKHREITIHHIDCYRLKKTEELIDIGVDEILSSEGISLIEWPQLVLPLIRGSYWNITIEAGDRENRRIIHIDYTTAGGDDGSRD
jgi:tRNA threonylcarbamoyladenosine biosynthesis protein TsaE